jgi:hypothetical protein
VAGRTWSTALPPFSHAALSPQLIRTGGLPHLDRFQATLCVSFLSSIEGDDAEASWTSISAGAWPFGLSVGSDRMGSAVLQVEAVRRGSGAGG